MNKFISYDDFKSIYNLQFEGEPAESSFLKFKQDVSSNYGPINSKKNTPPPILRTLSRAIVKKRPPTPPNLK